MNDRNDRRIRCFRVAVLLAAALFALPHAADAQRRDEAAQLRRRVVLLEDRVVELERQIARMEQLLRQQQSAPSMRRGVAVTGPGALPVPFREEGWRFQEAWRRLERGYSQMEVRQLLGRPERIAAGPTETVWFYPAGGQVHFSAFGERVEAWREGFVEP